MKYRILAVDDEIEICKIIDTFLTKEGFEVLTAQSGEEALKILGKEKINLMILDKRMPGIGGAGVLKELKRKKIDIPVIILSGSQDVTNDTVDKIKEMGYKDILFKPVDLNVLLAKVNEKLGI